MTSLEQKYPSLFHFFAGYFPDADFENFSDEDVVKSYVSDCSKSSYSMQELILTKEELNDLILNVESFWIEIAHESNRHFETVDDAKRWLMMVKLEIEKGGLSS